MPQLCHTPLFACRNDLRTLFVGTLSKRGRRAMKAGNYAEKMLVGEWRRQPSEVRSGVEETRARGPQAAQEDVVATRPVAKSVYAWALKAQGRKLPCRFESCPGHLLRPPARHPLRRGTGRERRLRAPIGVHHIDLLIAVPRRGEHNPAPVRRPGRIELVG